MVKDQHPQSVKEASDSVLPVWLEAFKVLLNMDPHQDVADASNWDGLAIRIQIFKVPSSFVFDCCYSPLKSRHLTRSTLPSLAP
jgi:hypothetical protein